MAILGAFKCLGSSNWFFCGKPALKKTGELVKIRAMSGYGNKLAGRITARGTVCPLPLANILHTHWY
jgi:hypothetical protein